MKRLGVFFLPLDGMLFSVNLPPSVKVGFYLKAVFPSRNLSLMRISRSRFKQSKKCSFISRIYVVRSFLNFWVIFGDIWGGEFESFSQSISEI